MMLNGAPPNVPPPPPAELVIRQLRELQRQIEAEVSALAEIANAPPEDPRKPEIPMRMFNVAMIRLATLDAKLDLLNIRMGTAQPERPLVMVPR